MSSSRLERRYARMSDEKLRLRAQNLDRFADLERAVVLEEVSARRLSLDIVVEVEQEVVPKSPSSQKGVSFTLRNPPKQDKPQSAIVKWWLSLNSTKPILALTIISILVLGLIAGVTWMVFSVLGPSLFLFLILICVCIKMVISLYHSVDER